MFVCICCLITSHLVLTLVLFISLSVYPCYEVWKSNAAHKCYEAANTWSLSVSFQFDIVTEMPSFPYRLNKTVARVCKISATVIVGYVDSDTSHYLL